MFAQEGLTKQRLAMKRSLLYIALHSIFVLSVVASARSASWEFSNPREVEDSVAVRLLEYRKRLDLPTICYKEEYNPIVRQWSENFLEVKNPDLYFTLNGKDSRCPHFNFDERTEVTNISRISRFYKVQEIAQFTAIKKIKVDDALFKQVIDNFDGSPKHKEAMSSSWPTSFSVGFYYNQDKGIWCCYVLFFTEYEYEQTTVSKLN